MFSKILLSLFVLLQAGQTTVLVDRIAAVVNDEIVTLTDIDKAIQFYPMFREQGDSEEDFYVKALEELIDYKVVYLEYRGELNLVEEDFAQVQTPIIRKLGSLDKLLALLERFDMEWPDFKDFIKEKVMYEKVVKDKLQIDIHIDFRDIESFYDEEYMPQQQSLGLEPRTLIEMAPLIERRLKEIRTGERLADRLQEIRSSYKIENKLKEESR